MVKITQSDFAQNGELNERKRRAWAVSVAGEMWGRPVQTFKTILAMYNISFYWATTPGHGGMVVIGRNNIVTDKWKKFLNSYIQVANYGAWKFEEDCDWAVPYLFVPKLIAETNRKHLFTNPVTIESVMQTVKRWNPEMLI